MSLEKLLTEAIVTQVMIELKNQGGVITTDQAKDLIKSSDEKIIQAVNDTIATANNQINSNLLSFKQEIADRIGKEVNTNRTKILEIRDYRLVDSEGKPRVIDIGRQHPCFEDLCLYSRLWPVYIYGPTGSGKTYATKLIAEKVLNIPFYRKIMSPTTSEAYLLGYSDAQGRYVEGIFYKPFVEGGLLLIDEIDNGNPAVNMCVKMLTDTDTCFFPVIGNKKKHKDFHLIANANTVGSGATRQYVGRSPQDKAMLNTFGGFVEWNYDKDLERELAMAEYKQAGGSIEKDCETALDNLWRIRDAAAELQLEYILSTRNIIHNMKLLAQYPNPTKEQLKKITVATILRDCNKEQFRKILEKANTMRTNITTGLEVEVLPPDRAPF